MATSAGAMSRLAESTSGDEEDTVEAVYNVVKPYYNPDEYPKEIPSPSRCRRSRKPECFGAKREHWKRAPHPVLTVVELGTLVSINWVCPDVRDRQRSFCTYGRVKMSYISVRG